MSILDSGAFSSAQLGAYTARVGEAGVTNAGWPYLDPRRYGAAFDGVTDDAAAWQLSFNNVPAGGTIRIDQANGLTSVIGTEVVRQRSCKIEVAGSLTVQAKAASAVVNIFSATDIDNVETTGIIFDGNNTAKNGDGFYASTRSANGCTWRRCRSVNVNPGPLPSDWYNNAGFRVLALGGAAAVNRPQAVRFIECDNLNCNSVGAQVAYADNVRVIGGFFSNNAAAHGFELVGCTNVRGDVVGGQNCGGSALDIGDHSNGFDIGCVYSDNCTGDAGMSIENTSVNGSIQQWHAWNCRKCGMSVSYGTAGTYPNDLLRNVRVLNGEARAIAPLTITGISKAANAVVTAPNHGFDARCTSPFVVFFQNVVGMVQINGLSAQIATIIDANNFSVAINSTAFTTYTSGGQVGIALPGINAFGVSAPLAQGLDISDATIDGFNGGASLNFATWSHVHHLTVTNLQGPLSYAVKTQFCQFTFVEDNKCLSTTGDHAYQALTQSGVPANQPDYVFFRRNSVLSSGAGATKALVYFEGTGNCVTDGNVTGGSSSYAKFNAAALWQVAGPSYGAVTTGLFEGAPVFQVASVPSLDAVNLPAYGAAVQIDVSQGRTFRVVVTNATAFTIGAPVPAGRLYTGLRITVILKNTTAGAIAGTFNATYHLDVATMPAAGKSRSWTFEYDGANWIQVAPNSGDITN